MPQNRYQHISDAALLTYYHQDGDNKWLGILLQRYTLLLFGVCMKYLKSESAAEDAVQQIFLKSVTELQKYPVTYFKSWLYILAKNHCLITLRGKKFTSSMDDDLPITTQEPDYSALEKEEKYYDALEICLAKLNEEQKICINLFFHQDKTYQEVCSETGYSMMQVKSYIQNGKRNLKLLIEKHLKQQS